MESLQRYALFSEVNNSPVALESLQISQMQHRRTPGLKMTSISWQGGLWPLIALAPNAMIRRSPADLFASHDPFAPARSSGVICLVDSLVFAVWIVVGMQAGVGFRESTRIYRCDLGIYNVEDNALLTGTPIVGFTLFALIPAASCFEPFVRNVGHPIVKTLGCYFLNSLHY